jgi:PhzF family phenazine biosynthesis protein
VQRPFVEVDVFTAEAYRGNPLAVVVDGTGLSDVEMQRFANWTNFSETTFLLRPTDPAADYRVRIFTTSTELPFAGHPTIGSCTAWLHHGGVPRTTGQIVQQCGVGLVTIRQASNGRLAFAAPPMLRHGPLEPSVLDAAVDALGVRADAVLDAAWIDNGPGWLGVLLATADEVRAIRPRNTALKIGVIGAADEGADHAYEVRAFFPEGDPSTPTTFEDPVTGSLNASAAQWLIGAGRFTPPYVAVQGSVLGRAGRVYISTDAAVDSTSGGPATQVWVGGDAVICVAGVVDL